MLSFLRSGASGTALFGLVAFALVGTNFHLNAVNHRLAARAEAAEDWLRHELSVRIGSIAPLVSGIWTPSSRASADRLRLGVIARLRPSARLGDLQSELHAVGAAAVPGHRTASAVPLCDALPGERKQALRMATQRSFCSHSALSPHSRYSSRARLPALRLIGFN
jgi:hypothetical protein